ncbi:hypothetical protein STCU_05962 [Strigomonas culicis]|uniref:MSP domain-containing protein n=1 Tax=Strigomonas culicis TaxID=28005 RepID=S9UE74_9TRYP|nr:hypothetical protein STCU_05962 [Strigomonas culicis]|eukprot:EPY27019.1 hypothetical protein STCU_05962 [Strigomonas culicis]
MSTPNLIVNPEKFELVAGVSEDYTIELTNVGYDAIIFRLLTTSPDRYIVRHTKGVIRGNSSMKVMVSINKQYVQDHQHDDTKIVKDDFRVESALLEESDIVEPRFANVPQLIKEKKNAHPENIVKKMIRCHLRLDAAATGTSPSVGSAPASRPNAEAASAAPAKAAGTAMTAKQMEANTLREKTNERRWAPRRR